MITEADLTPLLAAVPSFAPTWQRHRGEVAPAMLAHDLCLWLAAHLIQRAVEDDFSELRPVFGALDELYRREEEELSTILTVGLLEDLMHLAEDKGIALDRIARELTGVETTRWWHAAYDYIRRDDERR